MPNRFGYHQVVWLYFRFTLNFRDAEDIMAQRSVEVGKNAISIKLDMNGIAATFDTEDRCGTLCSWRLKAARRAKTG